MGGGPSEKDESVLLYPVFMIKVALMSPAEQKRKWLVIQSQPCDWWGWCKEESKRVLMILERLAFQEKAFVLQVLGEFARWLILATIACFVQGGLWTATDQMPTDVKGDSALDVKCCPYLHGGQSEESLLFSGCQGPAATVLQITSQ